MRFVRCAFLSQTKRYKIISRTLVFWFFSQLSTVLRTGSHYWRFETSDSSLARKYEASCDATRSEISKGYDTANGISASFSSSLLPTRIESSRGRRNARPVALIIRAWALGPARRLLLSALQHLKCRWPMCDGM